jgi:hypothetical protein
MSESKKSGKKKVSAPKTVKAVGQTKKVTVEDQAPTHSPQGLSLRALEQAGVTEEEMKGLISVGMKWVSRLPEAQEAAISRDRALARGAHAFAHVAERLGVAAEKVGMNSDRIGVALHKVGNLVAFAADMLDHNQAAVRATVGAKVWETGLRAVQAVAQALGQDIPQATAEWVATAEATPAIPDQKPVEMGGTKPVEHPQKHHKKERRERKQEPLRASVADQLKAKGHVPETPAAE